MRYHHRCSNNQHLDTGHKKIMNEPFGNPLVPLENTKYASVFLLAGRTSTTGVFLFLTPSIMLQKLCLLARPLTAFALGPTVSFTRWMRSSEMPTSLATGIKAFKNFASAKMRVAFERVSACLSSKGVLYDEMRANGTAMRRHAWTRVMYSCKTLEKQRG